MRLGAIVLASVVLVAGCAESKDDRYYETHEIKNLTVILLDDQALQRRWRYVSTTNGVHCGRYGERTNRIPASPGVRLPLARLQPTHEHTTFSHVEVPPLERGTTWSSESSWVLNFLPQYWHIE